MLIGCFFLFGQSVQVQQLDLSIAISIIILIKSVEYVFLVTYHDECRFSMANKIYQKSIEERNNIPSDSGLLWERLILDIIFHILDYRWNSFSLFFRRYSKDIKVFIMDGLIHFEMQGVQKLKCATCGTMFMSEIDTDTCPSCSEQSHSHREYGSSSSMGGCGCGH
jgi:hypothetical protein